MTKLDDLHYDLHERIREADPARGLEARPLTDSDLTREIDAILASAEGAPALRRESRPRRRMTIVAAAVALAAALGASPLIIDAVTSPDPSGSATSPTTSPLRGAGAQAAELLRRAAEITPEDPPLRPGQFWEVTTVSRQNEQPGQPGDEVRRIEYIAVDGNSPTYFFDEQSGGAGADTWRKDLSPNETPAYWQTPTADFVAALPRGTQALRDRVYADSQGQGNSRDGEVLVFAADILRSGIVPADLRASLFRVLETVPGIVVTDAQAWINGRTGVAIAYEESDHGFRQELVIDSTDGTVLGERSVVVRPVKDPNTGREWPAGVVYESSSTRRVVDSVPEAVRAAARCEVVGFPGRTAPPRC